jgi:hypothetical protein
MIWRGRGVKEDATCADVIEHLSAIAYAVLQDILDTSSQFIQFVLTHSLGSFSQ